MSDTFAAAIAEVSRARDQVAGKIAQAYPCGVGLGAATVAELRALGCSPAQAQRLRGALRLAAEVELLRQPLPEHATGPERAVRFLRRHVNVAELDVEHFYVMCLNGRQRFLMPPKVVAVGSLAQVEVHPREVVLAAVRVRAHSIVLAHNHPSQDPEPSEADVDLTRRLVEVGRLVGIPVLDHLVVTATEAVSLASMGFV
jgi:DNA repair protein RadC